MRKTAIILACLFAASAVGNVSAQDVGIQNPNVSTPTTMYMHLDGIQDFPINTQAPDDRYSKAEAFGLGTSSTSCLPPVPGASLTSKSWHTYYGYSTPGYVEYDFEEDGGPRYHKERGISFDAKLDTSAPFTVYWYLETQAASGDLDQADPNQVPIVVPQVAVRATMRHGDDVSVGDAAYNDGGVIAIGETDPVDLSPQAPNYMEVNGRHVYEFAIPMSFQDDTVTRDEAFNIRIDVFMDNPACSGEGYFMPNVVRLHTSPDHRPRFDWSVLNPLVINYIHPQFVGDELVIHTEMNSPWGNYDVDESDGGIQVSVSGPSPALSLQRAAFVQRHHEHFFHQEPVAVTYIWPYLQDSASNGVYTVEVKARNDQGTAEAVGRAAFEIGKNVGISDTGEEVESVGQEAQEESPGIGLLALLGAVAAAGLAGRRRQ